MNLGLYRDVEAKGAAQLQGFAILLGYLWGMYLYPCPQRGHPAWTVNTRLLSETRAIFSFPMRNEIILGHPCVPCAVSFEPVAQDADEQTRTRCVWCRTFPFEVRNNLVRHMRGIGLCSVQVAIGHQSSLPILCRQVADDLLVLACQMASDLGVSRDTDKSKQTSDALIRYHCVHLCSPGDAGAGCVLDVAHTIGNTPRTQHLPCQIKWNAAHNRAP